MRLWGDKFALGFARLLRQVHKNINKHSALMFSLHASQALTWPVAPQPAGQSLGQQRLSRA